MKLVGVKWLTLVAQEEVLVLEESTNGFEDELLGVHVIRDELIKSVIWANLEKRVRGQKNDEIGYSLKSLHI